ncbi:hypothetical protein AwDysgo_10990 [Bacteroidales bacterium]|nr:hypothetical protein AwDysgo_10990 [Bacteroidales bacterium]
MKKKDLFSKLNKEDLFTKLTKSELENFKGGQKVYYPQLPGPIFIGSPPPMTVGVGVGVKF